MHGLIVDEEKMKARHFPMFFNIKDKKILIIGAGKIAYRRIKSLLDFDVKICIIAPCVDERILAIKEMGFDLKILKCKVEIEDFSTEKTKCNKVEIYQFVKESDIVLAATCDFKLNASIVHFAKIHGKWVNNASDMEQCDFFFPALVKMDRITVGIAGDGSDHKRVREIAKKIRECLAEDSKKTSV